MTDPIPTSGPLLPTTPPTNRVLKITLAVSVALNLAVLGLIGGLALHGGPGPRGDMMVRDFGFGPFDGALLPEDREALRKRIQDRVGDVRAARQLMQADGTAILSALRADPFNEKSLADALDLQAQHLDDRLKFGSGVIREFLLSLPPEGRTAFADRLEQRLRHGQNQDGKDPGKD
jgi:uncharacterized membrane protein